MAEKWPTGSRRRKGQRFLMHFGPCCGGVTLAHPCMRACFIVRVRIGVRAKQWYQLGGQGSHGRPPAGRPEFRGPPSPERGGPCGEGRVTCPWHIDIFHWHIDDFHCHNDIFHTTGVQWRAGGGSSEAFMIPEGGTLN